MAVAAQVQQLGPGAIRIPGLAQQLAGEIQNFDPPRSTMRLDAGR